MKLYKDINHRIFYTGKVYPPHGKPLLPGALKQNDKEIRGMKEVQGRTAMLWNTQTRLFGEDKESYLILLVRSRESLIEMYRSLFDGRTGEYDLHSYHLYDHTKRKIYTIFNDIPTLIRASVILKIKLGWMHEVIRYGGD